MLRSELMSWPVTLAILVLAFGSLVAAGLPLMLTVIGLTAAAGSLYLASRLADVSIWAMNFALMFALALGIDYALFIVSRYRENRTAGQVNRQALSAAMGSSGTAVFFAGGTVVLAMAALALTGVGFLASIGLGTSIVVLFAVATALTLLPALLSPHRAR